MLMFEIDSLTTLVCYLNTWTKILNLKKFFSKKFSSFECCKFCLKWLQKKKNFEQFVKIVNLATLSKFRNLQTFAELLELSIDRFLVKRKLQEIFKLIIKFDDLATLLLYLWSHKLLTEVFKSLSQTNFNGTNLISKNRSTSSKFVSNLSNDMLTKPAKLRGDGTRSQLH